MSIFSLIESSFLKNHHRVYFITSDFPDIFIHFNVSVNVSLSHRERKTFRLNVIKTHQMCVRQ